MTIVRVQHYELDTLTRTEYFTDRELADTVTSGWPVTSWGRLAFTTIDVTESTPQTPGPTPAPGKPERHTST